jgi:hypothetical protein
MATVNTTKSWNAEVRDWLKAVTSDVRWSFAFDMRARPAVAQSWQFPKNDLFRILRAFSGPVATQLMKVVIRKAAKDLGITLSDEEIGILADVAVAAL